MNTTEPTPSSERAPGRNPTPATSPASERPSNQLWHDLRAALASLRVFHALARESPVETLRDPEVNASVEECLNTIERFVEDQFLPRKC